MAGACELHESNDRPATVRFMQMQVARISAWTHGPRDPAKGRKVFLGQGPEAELTRSCRAFDGWVPSKAPHAELLLDFVMPCSFCLMMSALDLAPSLPLGLAENGRARRQQAIRRANILATTRHLIAVRGYRQFNIGEVADICNVSIQTIYYNFGTKKELILISFHEYNKNIHYFCYRRNKNPSVFLDIATSYLRCAKEFPNFIREWINCSFSPESPIVLELQAKGRKFKEEIISEISPSFRMSEGRRPHSIAYLLSKTNTSSLYDWSIDGNIKKFEEDMILSTHEVIVSSFPDGLVHVEEWMASHGLSIARRTV